MLVGGVVEDQVEQHPQPEFVGTVDKGLGVVEGAVLRCHRAVVADVVADVALGAREER